MPAIARMAPNGSDTAETFVFRYPLGQRTAELARRRAIRPVPPQPGDRAAADPADAALAWSFATIAARTRWRQTTDFTVDPVAWQVGRARRRPGRPTNFDIDGDAGDTIRFGNDVFGASPAERRRVPGHLPHRPGRRRQCRGRHHHGDRSRRPGDPDAVRNPFAVTDGADAETADHIRRMAPQAFRAVQYRAVRAGGLRGGGGDAALGAEGRHLVPLDRQLDDGVHRRRSARQRADRHRRAGRSSSNC